MPRRPGDPPQGSAITISVGARRSTQAAQPFNLEGMERQFLTAALAEADWNVTQAARMPGLSRDTLRYRMEKYNIRIR
jgi:transcriptional regulator with GAF, ATPase, and Fis domain